MHYYQKNIGDYSTATPHLSLVEHGAYNRLLDYYYSTERPIPDDRCERIAGAYDPHERQAVRAVLEQFFKLTEEGWVNSRVEEELAKFRSKSLKAKQSAEARWDKPRCERNANAYPDAMLTINHKPITNKEDKSKEARARVDALPGTGVESDASKPRAPKAHDLFVGVDTSVVNDFVMLRNRKKAPVTPTVAKAMHAEAAKAGITVERALSICCERGWQSFRADWNWGAEPAQTSSQAPGGGRKEL